MPSCEICEIVKSTFCKDHLRWLFLKNRCVSLPIYGIAWSKYSIIYQLLVFSNRVFSNRHWQFRELLRFLIDHFSSFLPLPPAHEHSDIYLQLCMWDDYHVFVIAPHVIIKLLIYDIYWNECSFLHNVLCTKGTFFVFYTIYSLYYLTVFHLTSGIHFLACNEIKNH